MDVGGILTSVGWLIPYGMWVSRSGKELSWCYTAIHCLLYFTYFCTENNLYIPVKTSYWLSKITSTCFPCSQRVNTKHLTFILILPYLISALRQPNFNELCRFENYKKTSRVSSQLKTAAVMKWTWTRDWPRPRCCRVWWWPGCRYPTMARPSRSHSLRPGLAWRLSPISTQNQIKSILEPSSCLSSLLPNPRDLSITTRLRSANKFPRLPSRTRKYQTGHSTCILLVCCFLLMLVFWLFFFCLSLFFMYSFCYCIDLRRIKLNV